MSKALDENKSIQALVKIWTEHDIELVLDEIGRIVDDPEATRVQKMMSQFASIGSLYIQARRIQMMNDERKPPPSPEDYTHVGGD